MNQEEYDALPPGKKWKPDRSGKKDCTVCGYRSTFADGLLYAINPAVYQGESDGMASFTILACEEHKDWINEGALKKI